MASPFIQSVSGGQIRGRDLMPGVEVLGESGKHHLLRGRFYREVPEWIAFLCPLVAAGVIIFAALAQGSYEIARQIAALGILWL